MTARELIRWQKQLEIFPDDAATTLGQLMLRLAPTLEAFTLPRDAEQGDVDGFDGIARRGSYERLLPSEWLLRESLPLEFLRRATQAEHSFFQFARRESGPTRSSLALFDAGPDQLGACRLAQLALLLLLAHHAERRGETLNWQHLHRFDQPPVHTLDEHSVRTFLDGRTARRSLPSDLHAWQQRFADHDLWLVGARRLLSEANPAATAISIPESVALEARQLEIRFSALGRPVRERTLQLPEPEQATRLLRNPFEIQRAAPISRPAPARRSNLILNPTGSRLYYLNEGGELIALAVPSSASAHSGTARTYQADSASKIIGVAGLSGKQHWLCVNGGTLTLRSNRDSPLVAQCQSNLGQWPPELWPLMWFPEQRMATFVAPDRSLWRVDFGTGRAHAVAEGVRAVLIGHGAPLVAVDSLLEDGEAGLPRVLAVEPFKVRALVHGTRPWRSVFLGASQHSLHWQLGFEEDPGRLRILVAPVGKGVDHQSFPESVLYPPKGETVVAVHTNQDGQLGFVSLDPSRRTFRIFTRNTERHVFTASSPIAEVVSAGRSGALGFVTAEGELGVVERSGQHRLQRQLAAV